MGKRDFRTEKLAVKYAKAVKEDPRNSKFTRKEILAEACEIIASDGSAVEVNRDISKVDVTYLPSLHGIMTNTYAVIDGEVRRLLQRSLGSDGLDASQSRHLGTLTRALCQLAQLEMGIREKNALEYMPDDQLKDLADTAYKRLKANLEGVTKGKDGK